MSAAEPCNGSVRFGPGRPTRVRGAGTGTRTQKSMGTGSIFQTVYGYGSVTGSIPPGTVRSRFQG